MFEEAMYDQKTEFLRHTVATLAYRASKALRGAPAGFGEFRAGPGTRTPSQILAHLGDLLDWALSLANGKETWHNSRPLEWDAGVSRFFGALEALETRLANGAELGAAPEKLFQAPIADCLTHVGQIAMLRRLAGSAVRGENYLQAGIAAGQVGAEQPAAVFEFD
jgi:hypothetical protein